MMIRLCDPLENPLLCRGIILFVNLEWSVGLTAKITKIKDSVWNSQAVEPDFLLAIATLFACSGESYLTI